MKPYLSIVATSRNDGHGGNIMKRTRLFVNGLIQQSRKFQLPIELIIVEWNPPEGKPLLQEELPKPKPEDPIRIRYIVVPNETHMLYKRGAEIPLYQMIAKNVGIRRAKADFILCTNIDLIFSDALFRKLKKMDLRDDTFYRANRCDIPDKIDETWPLEQQLKYAEDNIITRHGRDSRFPRISFQTKSILNRYLLTNWMLDKAALCFRMIFPSERTQYELLDLWACGDFTLMHRKIWEDIQGYVELDLYSIHIDSLGLIAASALGYKQVILPRKECTYHIDHPLGWSSMSPLEQMKFVEKRPGLGFGIVWNTAMHTIKNKIRFDVNPPTWGFSETTFEEYEF